MTWRYVESRDVDAPLLRRLAAVWRYRTLLRRMADREARLRYAGAALGRVWAIVYPLLLVSFYALVFTTAFRGRLGPTGADAAPARYALYVVSGLVPWLAFSEVATRSVQTMAENRALVKHVMFPVQILPLTGVYGLLVPQAVALAALLAFSVWANGEPRWNLPVLALTLALQLLLFAGVAWLLGAVGAVLKDVRELLAIALTAGMFTTPIFYVERDAPALLRGVIALNPLTYLIRAYRVALLGDASASSDVSATLIVLGAISLALLLFGFWTFERTRVFLADIL
jgi:lipopolysaccharide transport system permease protein